MAIKNVEVSQELILLQLYWTIWKTVAHAMYHNLMLFWLFLISLGSTTRTLPLPVIGPIDKNSSTQSLLTLQASDALVKHLVAAQQELSTSSWGNLPFIGVNTNTTSFNDYRHWHHVFNGDQSGQQIANWPKEKSLTNLNSTATKM